MTRDEIIIKLKSSTDIPWYKEKSCLEAVKQDGYALQYVKEQSEAVCLEAVKQDGDALRYVKEQSEAVCLEAVKRNGYALQYVNIKTFGLRIEDFEVKKS